jgi:deoxyribodipyrimidine photolyase-related protein
VTALLLFDDQPGPHFHAEHSGEVLLVESAAALRRRP